MAKKMYLVLVMLLFTFLFIGTQACAYTSEQWSLLVNLAGRERMRTQKMTKEALLIAVGHDASKNKETLKRTIENFDTDLKRLINGDSSVNLPQINTAAIRTELSSLSTQWEAYKKLMTQAVSGPQIDVAQIAVLNKPFTETANKCVFLLAEEGTKDTGKAGSNFVNYSGRLRVLSQMMTKDTLLIVLEQDKDASMINLQQSLDDFEKTLQALQSGSEELGLPKMSAVELLKFKQEITAITDIWNLMKPGIQKFIAGTGTKTDIPDLAKHSSDILAAIEVLVLKYGSRV